MRKSVEVARKTTEIQETMDVQYATRWKEAEAQVGVTQESNSAQVQQLVYVGVNWSIKNCILPMRDACSWRHKPSVCHKRWNSKL